MTPRRGAAYSEEDGLFLLPLLKTCVEMSIPMDERMEYASTVDGRPRPVRTSTLSRGIFSATDI